MNLSELVRGRTQYAGAGITLLAAGLLTACASMPRPTADLAMAKSAVDAAVSAGATEFAPVELKTAQDKQDRAEQLARDDDGYREAKRLAEEAAADAKLAEARALAVKAQKSVEQAQKSQRALQEEIQRQQP